VHFDYKPPRTEDLEGVWETARGCMRNYLILREKVQAFRADPEVAEVLAAARITEITQPTLGAGETLEELRKATFDPDALAQRGLGFERLDQLAMDHLLGVR
jgi:xylose isomerase